MTKVLLILTVVLIFIYGFRMMSKLDRFLASLDRESRVLFVRSVFFVPFVSLGYRA